jgi:hypothetical protein
MYISGPQREDLLVLVWNMEDHAVDLNMYSDDNYRADVWYWRAAGTDLSGYADDGMCIVSSDEVKPQTRDINISRIECSRGKGKSGKKRYFLWTADAGDAPYTQKRHPREYQGEDIDVFGPSVPSGSRADIKAKGVWKDGYWTVELSRRLQTGYPDDVQFDIHRTYQFRICCQGGKRGTLEAYTAAALFGCEDVAGGIFLQFEPR